MVESKGAKNILGGLAAQFDFQIKVSKIKNTLASVLMSDAKKHRASTKKNDDDDGDGKPADLKNEPSIFNVFQEDAAAVKNIGKDLLERVKY
jgi:hypothetical protein